MIKTYSFLAISLFYLAGCGQLAFWQKNHQSQPGQTANSQQTTVKKEIKTNDSEKISGTYYANIKHQNCRSLRVNIVFEVNKTYEKVVECMNNQSEPFYESGNWQLFENSLTLQSATPIETTPEITHFVLKANQLHLKTNLNGTILFRKQH